MILGESMIEAGLVEASDIEQALDRQKKLGGALGQNLVALGVITPDQLDQVFNLQPPNVRSVEESGLDPVFLMTLALKICHTYNTDTNSRICRRTEITQRGRGQFDGHGSGARVSRRFGPAQGCRRGRAPLCLDRKGAPMGGRILQPVAIRWSGACAPGVLPAPSRAPAHNQ